MKLNAPDFRQFQFLCTMGLRIAVNTRFLLNNRLEGLGRFTHEVMQRWVADSPNTKFYFLFDRPYHPSFVYGPNVEPIVIYPPARHWLLWKIWFDYSLPFVLRKLKPDIFVSPDGYLSLNHDGFQLPVIHDLAFEHPNHGLSQAVLQYYRRNFPKFAKKARRIATVSDFSAHDIIEKYNINPDKIDIIYNGASAIFQPINSAEKQSIQKQFTEGKEFFLFIGALHPRKNITNLLKAFDIFKESDTRGIKLVIVGRKAWGNQEMEMAYAAMKNSDDVLFTGRLNDDDMSRLCASALASVNVSWLEGFGLPVLEALQSKTPVICSANSALSEVAQHAGLTVNPASPHDIAEKMRMMSTDEILRSQLIENAGARAAFFSWEKTASLLWDSTNKALQWA